MRQDWLFHYQAQDVANAAAKKRNHHMQREAWWKDQQDQVMRDVREKGIEVDESIANLYANSAAMHGARVSIKDEYQIKLNECHAKIKLHNGKVREYDGWVQVLQGRTIRVGLDFDDYLFFFGE